MPIDTQLTDSFGAALLKLSQRWGTSEAEFIFNAERLIALADSADPLESPEETRGLVESVTELVLGNRAGDYLRPRSSAGVFNFSPEERAAVSELVQAVTTHFKIELTEDEAQLMVNLAALVPHVLASEKSLRTKATQKLAATNTALSQACLAALAKVTIHMHTLTYDNDVNLRGLSLLQTVITIVAGLTQAPKAVKPLGG